MLSTATQYKYKYRENRVRIKGNQTTRNEMEFAFEGTNTIEHMKDNIRNCADCDEKNVAWCDLRYGCYLCIGCAMVHKYMVKGEEGEVKSLQCDNWTEEELGKAVGNETADNLEDRIPDFYPKPISESLHIIKYEYIHDKYIRQLFSSQHNKEGYYGFTEMKSGYLYKKGKNNESWNKRFFHISDDTLQYSSDYSQPNKVLQLASIVISIQSVSGKPYALAISHTPQDELTRTYYVYAETARETIQWYYTILAKQQNLAKECDEIERDRHSRRDHIKCGYMHKTGPRAKDRWRKRWFRITDNKVQYFEDETSPYPKGEFDLSSDGLYSVEDGCNANRSSPTNFTFTVKTPKRNYNFCAPDLDGKISWIQSFQRTMS